MPANQNITFQIQVQSERQEIMNTEEKGLVLTTAGWLCRVGPFAALQTGCIGWARKPTCSVTLESDDVTDIETGSYNYYSRRHSDVRLPTGYCILKKKKKR